MTDAEQAALVQGRITPTEKDEMWRLCYEALLRISYGQEVPARNAIERLAKIVEGL